MAFGMYALRFGSRPSNAAENARMHHFPYQPAASRWICGRHGCAGLRVGWLASRDQVNSERCHMFRDMFR
jgi:hypothetical protein